MSRIELSWDALKVVQEHFRESAFCICENGEEVAPQLFAVLASDEGQVLAFAGVPELTNMLFVNERGRRLFSQMLPALVGDTEMHRALVAVLGFAPNVFVQINECWIATQSLTSDDKRLPSQRPDREEAILINLHTSTLSIPCLHKIVTEPKRHAVKGEFPTQTDASLASGRMTMQDAIGQRGVKT